MCSVVLLLNLKSFYIFFLLLFLGDFLGISINLNYANLPSASHIPPPHHFRLSSEPVVSLNCFCVCLFSLQGRLGTSFGPNYGRKVLNSTNTAAIWRETPLLCNKCVGLELESSPKIGLTEARCLSCRSCLSCLSCQDMGQFTLVSA